MAALDGAVVVRPRPQRRGHPNQPGDERRLRQRQIESALAEDVLRHRFHAVDVAAEINAIEVQLENLLFRQALLDHQREDRFLALAEPVAARGGQKQRARELLRQRAAAFFESAGPHVADDGAADGDRIDADMRVESMIFDRDDGVAQVGGDAGEGHVAPMLFERKPRLPVGAVKHRLADAAPELVDREAVANDDDPGDGCHRNAHDRDGDDRVVFQRARMAQRQSHIAIVNWKIGSIGGLEECWQISINNLPIQQSANLPMYVFILQSPPPSRYPAGRRGR